METIKSWYHRIDVQVDRLIRQYKRKKFLLKAKVFLLFVLPVLILDHPLDQLAGLVPELIVANIHQSSQNLDADQGPRHCHSIPIPEASSGSSGDRAKPVCDTRTCWKTSS